MFLNRAAIVSSVGLAAFAGPAFAQTAAVPVPPAQSAGPDSGTTDSAAIVVEARRRAESAQDVPLVVNAVTAQELSKLNIRDFKDIATVVPGLSLTPNTNGIGSVSTLRGVNQDVNVSGNNGTIQYYLDDAPVGGDLVFQTLFDIGQIEVLRGPQGTLRGRATPSGSITITSHQPDLDEPGAYVDGTVASANAKNVNFGIGTPIIKDKLAVRVAGVYDVNRGDRVYSVNSSIPPSNTTMGLRASVRAAPTDWLSGGFNFLTINHENIGYDQDISFSKVDPTVPTTGPSYGTFDYRDRKSVEFAPRDSVQDIKRYTWNAKASFAGQNLIYVGSHDTTTYHVVTDNDTAAQYPALVNTQVTSTHSANTSHEIRLQNEERVAGIFDYVVGYFQLTGRSVTHLDVGSLIQLRLGLPAFNFPAIAPPSVNVARVDIPNGNNKEQSYFGNLTAHLGEGTEVSGGLRHIKYTDPGQVLLVNGAVSSPALANSFSKTIYNATIRHRFNADFLVYASTGSSIRPGAHAIGDFSAAPFSANEQAHTHTSPETSKSYEIGFKSELLDKKVTANLTYFHQNFKDYPFRAGSTIYYLSYPDGSTPTVAATGSGGNGFNFVSAVPVKVDGVEGELDFHPSRHLYVDSTISYTKSRIGSAQVACNLTPTGTVPTVAQLQAAFAAAGTPGEHLGVCTGAGGQPANFQPKFAAQVQGEYSLSFNDRAEGFIRGLATIRGSTVNDPSNPFDNVGAYAIFNAYVGLRDRHGVWQLTFYGKNLANTTKIASLNGVPYTLSVTNVLLAPPTFRTVSGTSSTTYAGAYGGVTVTPPREFGVNLRIALGSR